MDNIRIIKTGLNVSKILKQLEKHPEDWGIQTRADGVKSMLTYGFPEVQAGVLQLVMGAVSEIGQYVGDSEICVPTAARADRPPGRAAVGRRAGPRRPRRLRGAHPRAAARGGADLRGADDRTGRTLAPFLQGHVPQGASRRLPRRASERVIGIEPGLGHHLVARGLPPGP